MTQKEIINLDFGWFYGRTRTSYTAMFKETAMANNKTWLAPEARRNLWLYFGWLFLFGFLAARHVSWRDEYQAWLVAVRTSTWAEFFSAVNHETQRPRSFLV